MRDWLNPMTSDLPEALQLGRVLEEAGLAAPGTRALRINAGITNMNWLVKSGEGAYFVKLYGEDTDTFIDRTSSVLASRRAGELGVSPRLLWQAYDPGAEIYEYLDGYRSCTLGDLQDDTLLQRIIDHHRIMHESEMVASTVTGFDDLDHRLVLADRHDLDLPPDFGSLLEQVARVREAVEAVGVEIGPCHNDTYAANYMIHPSGDIRVIDWEYASNNDRLWDAALIAYSSFDPMAQAKVARMYTGKDCPQTEARLYLYQGVICTSWSIWAALQARSSSIDFDYDKYSKWMQNVARYTMRDGRWERALSALT